MAQFVCEYESVDRFTITFMSLDPVDLKNDLDFQQTYRNLGSLQGRATVRDPESYVSRSFILSLFLSLSQREPYLWKINDYYIDQY